MDTDSKYIELTEMIIGIYYKVYNDLGYGFLENVYENAMMIDFKMKKHFRCFTICNKSVL